MMIKCAKRMSVGWQCSVRAPTTRAHRSPTALTRPGAIPELAQTPTRAQPSARNHFTVPERGGVEGWLGVAEEVSDISLACRQIGPIRFKSKFAQGDDVFRKRRSLFFKKMQCALCVAATRSADEFDYLLKLREAKLRYNLFDAALVEQQDSCDHILGHAFSGGPAHFLWIKIDTETSSLAFFA